MSSFIPAPYELFLALVKTFSRIQTPPTYASRLIFILSSVFYNSLGFIKENFINTDLFSNKSILFNGLNEEDSHKLVINLTLHSLESINKTYLGDDKLLKDYIDNNYQVVFVDESMFDLAIAQIDFYLEYRFNDGWNVDWPLTNLPNGDIELIVDQVQDIINWPHPESYTPVQGARIKALTGNWQNLIPPFNMDKTIIPNINSFHQYKNVQAETLLLYNKSQVLTDKEKIFAEFWQGNLKVGRKNSPPSVFWIIFMIYYMKTNKLPFEREIKIFNYLCASIFITGMFCWGVKYDNIDARPTQLCRLIKGLPLTYYNGVITSSDLWNSYIPIKPLPFPNYVSGHASFSSAASFVFDELFNENLDFNEIVFDKEGLMLLTHLFDNIEGDSFDMKTLSVPIGTTLLDGTVTKEVIMMDFTSWKAIAAQAAESRFLGGIHFNYDNQLGLQLGKLSYNNLKKDYSFVLE
jgi:hypothetical protein